MRRDSRQTELGTPKRIAFVLPFRLVRRSDYNSPRSASCLLLSLVPFRDERLVRSRMVFITDAPTVGVVGLRGVAQAIAQGSTYSKILRVRRNGSAGPPGPMG